MGSYGHTDLAPRPRVVPTSVRVCLLLGGGMNLAGWLVVFVGMVFVWIFGVHADLPARYQFRGEVETAEGKVTRTERTAFTEGGRRNSRGARVFANYYTFPAPDGELRTGVSYARGVELEKGAIVTIELPKGKPALSRIRGMRRGMLSPWAAIVCVIPVVGAILVLCGVWRGLRARALLAEGEMGLGVLKSKTPTAARVNRRTVYRLVFEFQARDGRTYEAVAKTHMPEQLEDDEQERLLYDPRKPSRAVMMDSLPGRPTTDRHGQIGDADPRRLMLTMLLPCLTVAGHGAFALLRWWLGSG